MADLRDAGPETAPPEALGTQVSRGLSWSLLGQILSRIMVFGTGIVLARLLTEEDFGVFALGLFFVNVLMAFNELGVIPALIRWDGDIREAAGTGLTMALGFSTMLYLIVFMAAPSFAAAFDEPAATPMLRILGLTIIIDGAISPYWAMLSRSFLQVRQTAAEAIGMVAYAVVGILAATGDVGATSMAWARIAGSVVTGVLFVVFSPVRVGPRFNRAHARKLWSFGWAIAAAQLVVELVFNLDYLVVGQVLGTASLGLYLLAFNLSSWPVSTISMAISRVSFAGFARLVGDRERLRLGFERALGLAISATVPLVGVIVVLAPELIRFLYGDRWLPAVTALRLLVVLGGMRVLFELGFELAAVDGRPRSVLRIRLAWLAALAPALIIGAVLDDLRGVGLAHAAVSLLVVVPLLVAEVRRSGVRPADLAALLVRPLGAMAISTVAMLAARAVVEGTFARLVVVGAVGVAVYAAALLPRNDLVRWIVSQMRGAPAAA